MSEPVQSPKRLIEVDLPIKRISAHARREKSIRHGHISTLHIWWARRPLAACRAVVCAALWPDPADPNCPQKFKDAAKARMLAWATDQSAKAGPESFTRLVAIQKEPTTLNDDIELRKALLDFIADFANWDNSTVAEYLDTSRALTQAAHEALGGPPGTRPLVVDPFAGGGSIPLEALRVGADAFASDLNPVPVLLNKVVLEYIPKYGKRLADEVRKWGEWIAREAEKELAEFYPRDKDGAMPIAYLWARTIQCEGPGCGVEVPLMRSRWLAKKANRSIALNLLPNPKAKRVDCQIIVKERDGWVDQVNPQTRIEDPKFEGTIKGVAVTCPCCGFTTQKAHVRAQIVDHAGGADSARLLCVVTNTAGESGRSYRLPNDSDFACVRAAFQRATELSRNSGPNGLPDEPIPHEKVWKNNPIRVHLYGMTQWKHIFTSRQAVAIATLSRLTRKLATKPVAKNDPVLAEAVAASLALAVGRQTDYTSSLCAWVPSGEFVCHTFGRQAIPMVWDFVEVAPLANSTGCFGGAVEWIANVLEREARALATVGHVESASATAHPLPDDSCAAVITDPPYYDAVPYSTLSNYFYIWLKRAVPAQLDSFFSERLAPNADECVVDEAKGKTHAVYEASMYVAMVEARRVLLPSGVCVVVFAHKSTSGWEALLQAMIRAGWIVTGSWPIDTERPGRLRANDSAALASSVHLVCRPRESPDGAVSSDDIGDFRSVLAELPKRIHEWMPRLAEEGIVGADAIFACLGPALEIFSRYSRVEMASGEVVTLREYLEHVWAAVSKEAVSMIFHDAETAGLEEDARLTAMWLWTLIAPSGAEATAGNEADRDGYDESSEEDGKTTKAKASGYVLEFDAARKIAVGLGANLDKLSHVVEVDKDKARLLPVVERTKYLFGKPEGAAAAAKRTAKKKQMTLFEEAVTEEETKGWGDLGAPTGASTVLDRVHQSMLLFASGRAEALKRFLVEDGIGKQPRFWKLAQSLSALYPGGSEEKRWVDGVLARKKGLGF